MLFRNLAVTQSGLDFSVVPSYLFPLSSCHAPLSAPPRAPSVLQMGLCILVLGSTRFGRCHRCSSFLKRRSMLVFRTPTKDDKTGWQLKTWTVKDWVQIFCSQELIWKSRDFNVYTGDFLLDFMLRWPRVWDAVNLKDDRVSKHCSGVRSQSAGCSAATLPPWRVSLPNEMKLIMQ